ncbi:MAG: hypothetical protein CM1200mP9_07100 [Gammaproteobacteria bacterium]|nr:MAG: hypothetical protein CM1200mP9_07100 [Gammaproteobacteria bacterium]
MSSVTVFQPNEKLSNWATSSNRRDLYKRRISRRHEQDVFVGQPSVLAQRLVKVTQECLYLGIQQVHPGAHLGDIGQRSNNTLKPTASLWLGNFAATALVTVFMTSLKFFIMDVPG